MSTYDYNYNGQPSPGSGGSRPPRWEPDWSRLSWLLSLVLTFVLGPIGLFLTVAHATGNDILGDFMRGIAQGVDRRRASAQEAAGKVRTEAAKKAQARKARKKAAEAGSAGRSDGVRRADRGAREKTVFGWVLVVFGLFATFGALIGHNGLWEVLSMLSVALGGGALAWSGVLSRRKEAKFRRCFAVSGDRGVVDIKKLAKTMGVDLKEASDLLTEMVDRGYYGEKAYIDHERCLLVINVEEMREVYRREDEEKAARKAADAQAKMSEYERYVERIRQADEDIEDEVMSEKIRRMQNITASIFAEVQAHPEKRPLIDRFMTYYLPTTLKLLESYAHIEEQGVSGENMAKAKADIERIADTLVVGYEKQLDNLYRAEAMDIAGDVGTIENMLKRDGLSGQSDFGTPLGGH